MNFLPEYGSDLDGEKARRHDPVAGVAVQPGQDLLASRLICQPFDGQARPGTLKRILAAGLRAPSNDHMRQWEFVIINDRTRRLQAIAKVKKNITREEVARFLDGWGAADECQRAMYFDAVPKQYKMR